MDAPSTLYDMAGGQSFIRQLVEAFYTMVPENPTLAPLFPEDLTEIREKQYLFLTQFFGGPPLFSQAYGSPMLRFRHLQVPIEPKHADAWLATMARAMDTTGLSGPLREIMFDRLTKAAHHMVNQ